MNGAHGHRWLTAGVVALLGLAWCVVAAAQGEAPKPDKIGNIELTDENYARLAERAKRMGREDLAEKLEGEDRGARLEAARELFGQTRGRGARAGAAGNAEAGRGFPGRGGQRGGPPDWVRAMQARGGMMGGVAVTTTEKYLFIVRGDQVLQLDVDTLEIINQIQLPRPQRPEGMGRTGRREREEGAPPAERTKKKRQAAE